ncbi:phenylalanine--tRNA ligase subunit beta, partial [Candidatus Margulisiibacteriota bacterium]
MKVPIEWLKEFVEIKIKPEELAEKLTMAGTEVGAIEYHGSSIKGVLVGKIKSLEKKDDKLICRVDVGSKLLQIVTDDQSLQVGDRVPVAQDNSELASEIKIKKISLHGIESFGMLCRPHELGLGSSEQVLKLPIQAKVGEDVKKVLGTGGQILDLDVLPNRGDLQSIIGVAREVAAVLNIKLQTPNIKVKESLVNNVAEVTVKNKKLCPRYMARVINNVKVKESPKWLKDRLLSCGIRSINNIVDITNYVLLEYGQPLHAFDQNRVDKIIVRNAEKDEELVTIDGIKRKLDPGMLVIADTQKPLAVAGIMGGSESEVSDKTTDILLESAFFDPVSVNKTSQQLKLRSESSIRFGKGVDWNGVAAALNRAAQLMAELGEGKIQKGKVDVKEKEQEEKTIQLRIAKVNRVLGLKLTAKTIKSLLSRLNFNVSSSDSHNLEVEIPLFRAGDIEREIDIIEEVSRIYGYDKIETTLPWVSQELEPDCLDELSKKAREVMVGAGLYEVQTFSILDPAYPKRLKLKEKHLTDFVRINNPLTEEESVLRTMLLPGLLKVLDYNQRHQIDKVRIFEVGKVYLKENKGGVEEKVMLGGLLTGKGIDFYLVKGIVS